MHTPATSSRYDRVMWISPTSDSPPYGVAMLPFALGLTAGLVIAAAVALYVTQAPVPFVDRGIQRASPATSPSATGPATQAATAEVLRPPEEEAKPQARTNTKPSAPPPPPQRAVTAPASPPASPTIASTASTAGGAGSAPSAGQSSPPVAASANQFFLQVAAFKSSEEADQMRARLAFMGYEAQISETRKDSLVFYRVRLGPYRSFEELNRAKTSLSENGLESTVVRSSQ
ncbi:MAG: hypothetical protein RLZZ344_1482 [Pseudomonadota bacterium]